MFLLVGKALLLYIQRLVFFNIFRPILESTSSCFKSLTRTELYVWLQFQLLYYYQRHFICNVLCSLIYYPIYNTMYVLRQRIWGPSIYYIHRKITFLTPFAPHTFCGPLPRLYIEISVFIPLQIFINYLSSIRHLF